MEITYIPAQRNDAAYMQLSLCRNAVQSEVSSEYVLPDYIGDVKRILHTFARLKHTECVIEGEQVRMNGEAVFTVVFVTEEGKTASTAFSVDYSAGSECPKAEGDTSELCAVAYPICESVTARLLSPRKLSVKGRIRNQLSVMGSGTVTPEMTGTHNAADEAALECRYETTESARIFRAERGGMNFSEDITLDGSESQIGEILFIGAEVSLPDCRASGGSLSVSGETIITALCTDPDGQLFSVQRHFPVSHVSDAAFPDGCPIWAYGTTESVKAAVQPNSYGENKVIEIDMTWAYSAEGAQNMQTRLLRDAYSTEYVCENTYAPLPLLSVKKCDRMHFSVNDSRPRAEAGAENAARVLQTSVNLQHGSMLPDENGKLLYQGTADVAMIVTDTEGAPRCVRYSIPVKYESEIQLPAGQCDYRLNAESVRGRLDSGTVFCDFEAILCITALEKQSETCLQEIRFDHDNPLPDRDRPPLTLYYPQDGEAVWDIARKYQTTSEAISAANHLTSDRIHGEKVLMIPKNQRKSVYSGII